MPRAVERDNLPRAITRLYRELGNERKRQFRFTLMLLVVGGIAELATIGAVFPFLAVITSVGTEGRLATLVGLLRSAGAHFGVGLFATAAFILIATALLSAAIRLLLSWVSYKFVFGCARDLGVSLYGRVLDQPYSYHVMRNSSETLAGLEKIQHVLAYVLAPLILGFTSLALAVFVFAAVLVLNPVIAIGGGLLFVAFYGVVSIATRQRLEANSQLISNSIRGRVQSVQEGLGGIRDIILDGSQGVFLGTFERAESSFRRAQTVNYFISTAPRFIVEAGIIILIAALALYIEGQPGGVVAALPVLGAVAVGAQRLMPLCQQIYSSWTQVSASKAVVFDVADLLGEPDQSDIITGGVARFERLITLDNISFAYPSEGRPALHEINLTIPKGSKLGLMGKSGSGKSTLADILMGLLDPSEGELQLDGVRLGDAGKVAWRKQVAHVPQAIYLADARVADNIAFGRDVRDIDMDRVHEAARDADIHDFIIGLPNGYDTEVGERGVRLSGGQRQRLGIARALYKGAEVLILDEATSALDDATEASVMESIGRLSSHLTVIIIAHRLTTLRECDQVVELRGGRIVACGRYDTMPGAAKA